MSNIIEAKFTLVDHVGPDTAQTIVDNIDLWINEGLKSKKVLRLRESLFDEVAPPTGTPAACCLGVACLMQPGLRAYTYGITDGSEYCDAYPKSDWLISLGMEPKPVGFKTTDPSLFTRLSRANDSLEDDEFWAEDGPVITLILEHRAAIAALIPASDES